MNAQPTPLMKPDVTCTRTSVIPSLLLLILAFSLTVGGHAATFVSFQEGDLRAGPDRTTVNSNGTLVNASYTMSATTIRLDLPTTTQDGSQLLVGNNNAQTNRTLLAFNVSYLENLMGTDLSRLDSAALILTHDNAGAGGSSVHGVYLTSPFDETTATWNNPHGGNTNAGGYIGASVRERSCIGTNASPTKELWGSPGASWPDSGTGTGADLLVEAVRGALTNSSKTLYLLVKRKSESASAYFSRYQHDGDADVHFRPELIVGVRDDTDVRALASYYFNENNNTVSSLAAVAAATVLDTNRVSAANVAAGPGLGQFGSGSISESTHGYGTAAYVSSPSGFYARANVTADNENDAVTNESYLSFTIGPQPGYALNFLAVSGWMKLQANSNFNATVVVRSSLDGFSNNLASLTVAGNSNASSFTFFSNNFNGALFTGVLNPVEFRFYLHDTTDSTSDIFRLDDITFLGASTNPPPDLQIISLAATDASATESGGDPGAFTLHRFGDASGALTVSYAVSGTASNGVDYEALNGIAEFAPGVSNLVIPLNPLDDITPEWEETVSLTLNANAAYFILGSPAATVRLLDDNDPPAMGLVATTPFAYERAPELPAMFTISRIIGTTNTAVAVQLVFSGSASNGVDYTATVTNQLLLEPGELSRTVMITPINDAEAEGNETIVLTLLPGAGYTVGAASSATATLLDNLGTASASLLVETESFATLGGWVVDQQFADLMGSSYLLAHGKGRPVADAITSAQFPTTGVYRLWARTKDWTAPFPEHPGSFKVAVDGLETSVTFGTVGQGWLWQDGGFVMITNPATEIRLRDLTGFDGRCDALFFTTDPEFVPTNTLPELTAWRRAQLGLSSPPASAGDFDLVIVGGGISGCSAALAAARQGLQVALVHDRPFPGGNASRDVRVHTLGNDLGGITSEINTPDYWIGSDQFIQSDERRMQVLERETNLHLFCEWRAFALTTNETRITSVDARHNRTGEERRFTAPLFIDSTGDGWIGYWAGALHRMGREARSEFNESLAPTNTDTMTMGSTLSWNSRVVGSPVSFPAVPWATNVAKDYSATSGDWWWEYGLQQSTIYDAEEIRDHLLQAIYGSFANAKKSPANANRELYWVAYVAGKRESRRLTGDYILSESDVRNHPAWPDAVVTERREIDIHFTKAGIYDWITYAQFTGISAYWIPFRCLYSTNVENLMMAGRCLSATHFGLGSPRVMNTGGQMGVATGTAAALCKKYNVTPRLVAQRFAGELQSLMGISHYMDTPSNTVAVIDNTDAAHATMTGTWPSSRSNSGYYGQDYAYDGNTNKGTMSFIFQPDLPVRGNYRVYLRWAAGPTRATNTPVDIIHRDGTSTVVLDQTLNGGLWVLLGTYAFELDGTASVVLRNDNTSGNVIADAVAFAVDFPLAPAFSGRPWQDDDGDGLVNYVEFLNGTNPRDPFSFTKVSLLRQENMATLRFVATAGKAYIIQYRDSLSEGGWQDYLYYDASPVAREIEVVDWLLQTDASRFYRIQAE